MSGRMNFKTRLAGGAAVAAILLGASAGAAQAADPVKFDIAPQPLTAALNEFGVQSNHAVLFTTDLTNAKISRGVNKEADPEIALAEMLNGTGLSFRRSGDAFLIVSASDPQSGSAGADAGTVQALIVTAQKREENIQDVPIAMSAFSQEDLTTRQVAGGPDLITQIPNFSFTKTNFTSYSIQIRGIGTQAISATTDPAVAVAFNNTPFIRNHFFEQEFYDLERLEVLRGPQGTLYGRNATAGVVNIVSAKPKFSYAAKLSGDLGNYNSTRLEGMINIPLVEDKVALRVAGAWTKRDGYAFNQMTDSPIDGRDLWSTRVSLRFEPTDNIHANLIWEHFQENDDRLRSGKQLCKKDVVTDIGGLPIPPTAGGGAQGVLSYISQGCTAVSLYSPEAFQTPNGYSLPYYGPTGDIGNAVFLQKDPYLSATQSQDLRSIESSVQPDYRAKNDIAELQLAFDIGHHLTLNSETAYSVDSLFSLEDYNRFTTIPHAFNTAAPTTISSGLLDANGVFCDPQLGCSDRLLLVDLSTSQSTQFSQEFRLSSDFDGPLNFSLGLNFLRHDALDKYYVFINSLSLWAGQHIAGYAPGVYVPNVSDGATCIAGQGRPGPVGDVAAYYDPSAAGYSVAGCWYMDPNPIGSLNDQGRNYFLSKNPYRLISYAAFGELYYNITPSLKLTGGLRWTVDKKAAPQIPSWLLVAFTAGPYPTNQTVYQEWREPTGRLALDWKPKLSFTDETLIYASYAHGYKAGGANPPPPVFAAYGGTAGGTETPAIELLPDTFGPEFVNAYELGTKNTLLDGTLTLNLTGFYYDYTGYQISEIRNRAAVNSNYDATVWGAELEADWRVTEALRLGVKGGYEKTRIADGESAIDLMDRTAGDPNWMVVRPFPSVPSNCIIPVFVATAGGINHIKPALGGSNQTNTSTSGICIDAYYKGVDPVTGMSYVANPYQNNPNRVSTRRLTAAYADYPGWDPSTAPNGGRGISKDLSGNELPNAPNWTATVTADYTMPLPHDWLLTLHGDYHWQSKSWWRVFNDLDYDRLKGFSTANLAAIFSNEDAGWKVMAYVKNVFDETALTGAFLNSDDTGLTTNIFLTEPRLYGLRVTKDFTDNGWLAGVFGSGERHQGPYPLTVEVGGGVARFGAKDQDYAPAWLNVYNAAFPMPSIQDQPLDWGDTREVKVTYAPPTGWRVSGAYRFGKTNSEAARGNGYQAVPGGYAINTVPKYKRSLYTPPPNYWRGAASGTEEHAIADFAVGREVGFGAWSEGVHTTLGVGIRGAKFKSTAFTQMVGVPDHYVPSEFHNLPPSGPQPYHTIYRTALTSAREFQGAGPSVDWETSVRLWGDEERGHADLDWTASGGVLFGKQSVDSREDRLGDYYYGTFATPTVLYNTPVERHRSDSATVPNLSLTLGVSYTVDRIKVSTGYSYDRFFKAIDGGVDTHASYDRTIDGPYFKIAIGFGS